MRNRLTGVTTNTNPTITYTYGDINHQDAATALHVLVLIYVE